MKIPLNCEDPICELVITIWSDIDDSPAFQKLEYNGGFQTFRSCQSQKNTMNVAQISQNPNYKVY